MKHRQKQKQKRLGLFIANAIPIVMLFAEIFMILRHQLGWAVGVSATVAVISLVIFLFHPYGEEVVFTVACTGYALTITCVWLTHILVDSSASLFMGLLFGCATMMAQAIFTAKRMRGEI